MGLSYVNFLANSFAKFPILILVFTLPALVDWLLQVFRVKSSTNPRRVLTGFLIGQTYLVGLVALTRAWFPLLLLYLLVFASYGVLLYALFRKTGIMSKYMADSWPISEF